MSRESNGVEVALHTITITHNPVTKETRCNFDPKQFPTFEFALGILEMAKLSLGDARELARIQDMQQQAVQAMQEQQIRKKLSM